MEAVALRALHVLAAALLVGVPLATAYARRPAPVSEWVFWAAIAVLVLGGVSNLGALPVLQPPSSRWGMVLTAKLVVLLALLGVGVARLGRTIAGEPAPALWTASAALAATALVLAVVLAHG